MSCLGTGFIVVVIVAVVSLVTYDVTVREPKRRAERNAQAEVLVNGYARDVHTITDRKTGRTMRVVTIDGNPITLSDEPAPAPAVEPTR